MPDEAQDDERRSRRGVVLWFTFGVALLLVLTIGTVGINLRGEPGNAPEADAPLSGTTEAAGAGRAEVFARSPENTAADQSPGGPSTRRTTDTRTAPGSSSQGSTTEPGTASGPGTDVANGSGGDERPHGIALILSSTIDGPLRPGLRRTLTVSVRNPNSFAVDLQRLDVRVEDPAVPGCLARWVRVAHWRDSTDQKRRVKGRATITVALPIQLINLATVNQDGCQGTAFPLTLSGVAVDAP